MNRILEIVMALIHKASIGLSMQTDGSAPSSTISPSEAVAMADVLRSEGKIYVVVAVILIIFIGLIAYLFRIERKLNDLSKEINEGE